MRLQPPDVDGGDVRVDELAEAVTELEGYV